MEKNVYPCDSTDSNGLHVCPFQSTYGGYEDEMCRNCCGLGVDGDEEYEEEYYEAD